MGVIDRILKREKKVGVNELNRLLYSHLVGNSPLILYDYNRQDYITKGYSQNSDIFKIINKITDKCAVATPYIYVDDGQVKSRFVSPRTSRDVAKNNLVRKSLEFADSSIDLVQLLEKPNDHQTWREFIQLGRLFYQVQGEMLIYREAGDDGCALSLHIAPSHLMTPVFSGDFNNPISGWKLQISREHNRELPVENVMHFKRANPNYDWRGSQLRGMPPLMAGLKALMLSDQSLEAWLKTMQNEGAKGIVSPNHPNPDLWLTPDQLKMTEKVVDEKIHGSKNRNRVVVSGMPLQYSAIGLSPDAMNIVTALDKANIDLCTLWGLSPVLFEANPTYQNQKEAGKRMVLETILPYLNAEEDKFNKWLVEPFSRRDGKNYLLDYDLSAFDELKLDIDDIDALLRVHTINEVRVMVGSDELDLDSANEVYIQAGLVPLSDYDFRIE